jgi:SAM-dependent methyltransferase
MPVPHRQRFTLFDYYVTSMLVGLRSLPGGYPKEAAARIINPLSYPRYIEYQLAVDPLFPIDGCRILDIGSPKLPALLFAREASCVLHSTDIRDYFIGPTTHFLRRMGLGQRVGRDIHLEVQDARSLSYPDAFFDKVFSISVLEHIPDDGDSQAVREITRVVRPGGTVTLTVPFSGSGYTEEFIRGPVYERADEDGSTFYQRRYDTATLRSRLVEPAGLEIVSTTYFGEPWIKFEPGWNRIPMRWKAPLLWAQPFLAKALLRPLRPTQLRDAVGVGLVLIKPRS